MNETFLIVALFLLVLTVLIILVLYWTRAIKEKFFLERFSENPILSPDPSHPWESEAVFNPGVVAHDGKVHMFYRAIGSEGISRIGYAWSDDSIHFHRMDEPVFDPDVQFSRKSGPYLPLSYDTDAYASGGSWGGIEDPRASAIGNRVYMTFTCFGGWDSIRLAVTSLSKTELDHKRWNWKKPIFMSPKREVNKNWVLFPEKIHGKFAVIHALTPKIMVEYVDSLEHLNDNPIKSNNKRGGRAGKWDAFVRGVGAPPIKTPQGWLLLYHGMDPKHPAIGYKVGAMLLKLDDPTVVLARTDEPILTPQEWYENDWKPGVVYASGAVVWKHDLVVYYGGGDKYIAAARIRLRDLIEKMLQHQPVQLQTV